MLGTKVQFLKLVGITPAQFQKIRELIALPSCSSEEVMTFWDEKFSATRCEKVKFVEFVCAKPNRMTKTYTVHLKINLVTECYKGAFTLDELRSGKADSAKGLLWAPLSGIMSELYVKLTGVLYQHELFYQGPQDQAEIRLQEMEEAEALRVADEISCG